MTMATFRSNWIQEIKERLSLPEAAARYGLEPRRGYLHCPFHSGDNTPSLRLYPNDTFYCFGCGAHGDVIDFVAGMEQKSKGEAIKMLAAEFGLDHKEVQPSDYAAKLRRERLKRQREEGKRWEHDAALALTAQLREFREVIQAGEENERFFDALTNIELVQFLAEQLTLDPAAAKRDYGGEIDRWISRRCQSKN